MPRPAGAGATRELVEHVAADAAVQEQRGERKKNALEAEAAAAEQQAAVAENKANLLDSQIDRS